MTTQAVTPSSAAAGLGLLNHPSMNFMMMHGIAGVHGIGGMGHGGLNPLAMLQNLQSPMGGHGYSAIAGHGAFPPSSIASNTPTPPHSSQQTATPAMPPTAASPAQIVPTQPPTLSQPLVGQAVDDYPKIEEVEVKAEVENEVSKSDVEATPISSPKCAEPTVEEEGVEHNHIEPDKQNRYPSDPKIEAPPPTADLTAPTSPKFSPNSPKMAGRPDGSEKAHSRASTPRTPTHHHPMVPVGMRSSQNGSPKPKTPITPPNAPTGQFHPALHGLGSGLGSLLNPTAFSNGINPALIQQQILLAQQQLAAQQQQAQQQLQIQQLQQALAIAQQNAQASAAAAAASNPLLGAAMQPQMQPAVSGASGMQANSAAAQQAASILATAQAQALQQRNQQLFANNPCLNPLLLNGLSGLQKQQQDVYGAKATAQQAISAAEKMYRDALHGTNKLPVTALSPAALNLRHDAQQVPNSSDVLKQLNLLRQSQNP